MHVTVLMAVFNGARQLERAVRSIQAQTYHDWDLLIVDDGSHDETPQILEEFLKQDTRISVLRNSHNAGLATSLNRGWREARGDLIARMDVDDVSEPTRLAKQEEFMRLNPDVAVLGCAAMLVDDRGMSLGRAARPELHSQLAARMYRETPFFHPRVMMRKRYLESMGGYDESLRFGQDSDLWLRSYRLFRFHNLPEVLLQYTQRPTFSFARAWSSMYIILRSAYRERLLLTKSWYAFYYGAAFILIKCGLKRPGVRVASGNAQMSI